MNIEQILSFLLTLDETNLVSFFKYVHSRIELDNMDELTAYAIAIETYKEELMNRR